LYGFVPRASIALLLAVMVRAPLASPTVHHDLHVQLYPDQGRIQVEDRMTWPEGLSQEDGQPRLHLHAGLRPQLVSPERSLVRTGTLKAMVPIAVYRLELAPNQRRMTLRYGGRIQHSLTTSSGGRGLSRRQTPGLISGQGVYLDANSAWYPRFDDEMLSFSLTAEAPPGWEVVSQGQRQMVPGDTGGPVVRWTESQPQDDIYLLAGQFRLYQRPGTPAEALVYLRRADDALAARYLDATLSYLTLYSRLLGPYPYGKFALVENFWETGYGMPSFTLLGPRVIRLPFILHSSYPHEILHNWWGNGVYIDVATGNWSEGLTAYLADHLVQAQRGRGAKYRRSALQKYADYVAAEKDFPLTAFRARHGAVSQAVGYNKTLMLFHMLRRRLGDRAFLAGLRHFYETNRFRQAGFADLREAFEQESGEDLKGWFAQWVERTGAPVLAVSAVGVDETHGRYHVSGTLEQTQGEPAYGLDVPIAVQLAGEEKAFEVVIPMHTRRTEFDLEVPGRPVRLVVDPRFDLFRRLDRREIPPSLGQLFGADAVHLVLPAAAPKPLREAYHRMATSWAEGPANIVWDDQIQSLPRTRNVWILGWDNRFRGRLESALRSQGVKLEDSAGTIGDQRFPRHSHSLVLSARHPASPDLAMAWLGSDRPEALPGLTRKLPHYGKYSYLAFAGDAPDNVLKGQWSGMNSPLNIRLGGGETPPMTLKPRPPLTATLSAGTQ